MTTDDGSAQDDVEAGRQILLSELEVAERRALLESDSVETEDKQGMQWNSLVKATTERLLHASWFQQLTLDEVEQLTAIQGWAWWRMDEWEEQGRPTVKDVIEYHLDCEMTLFLEDSDEILLDDLVNGTDKVQRKLQHFRKMADTYGFEIREVLRKFP